jgi:hypothetical protein
MSGLHIYTLIILCINVGSAVHRASITRVTGYGPIGGFLAKYDAAFGWSMAVFAYILYVGAKV